MTALQRRNGNYVTRNLTNQKFGMLIAVHPSISRNANREIIWECLCDCGKTCFLPVSNLLSGNTRSCGCLRSEGFPKGFPALIQRYKTSAKKRNLSFTLSRYEMYTLTQQNCYFCDQPPANVITSYGSYQRLTYTFVMNGIDRFDNTLGYTLENCVTCCKYCNIAKADLTVEEFYKRIKRIYMLRIKHEPDT